MTEDHKFDMLMVAVTGISQNMVKIDDRLDKIEQKMVKVDGRLDKIEQKMVKVDGRLDKIEQKMVKVDGRLDKIEQKMVKVDGRLDKIEQKMVKVDDRLDKIEHRMATEMVTKIDLDIRVCDVENGILTEVDRVQEFSSKLHDETKQWLHPMNINIRTNKSTTDLLSNRLYIVENNISTLQNLFS